MGVNISGNKINFKQLVTHISSVLSETGLDPSYLEIELTERVMMENTEEARRALLQLKEMGIAIAIDVYFRISPDIFRLLRNLSGRTQGQGL